MKRNQKLSTRLVENEICVDTGRQLRELEQYSAAAQLYLSVDSIRDAIDALIEGADWTKALKISHELDASYAPQVETAYRDWLTSQGKAEELADVDFSAALELLAQQGRWDHCLEEARRHGTQLLDKYMIECLVPSFYFNLIVFNASNEELRCHLLNDCGSWIVLIVRYVALYATQLIKEQRIDDALQLFIVHGAPAKAQNLNIYRHLAAQSLLNDKNDHAIWIPLRDVFYQLVSIYLYFYNIS